MQKLFESEANVPHVVHRRKAELLHYQFLMWHRPERTMWECDIFLQYNKATESWRENDAENAPTEVSLTAHSEMAKERADHQPVVIRTKIEYGCR